MTASTRTPSKRQTQVLFYLEHEMTSAYTAHVHEWREEQAEAAGRGITEKQRETYMLLAACHRYGWIRRFEHHDQPRDDNDGNRWGWAILPAGTEALQRGQAALAQPKGDEVDTTTKEPPAGTAPWEGEDDPATEPAGDPEALGELDAESEEEEPALEGEVEETEDDNPPVNEGSNQLSLAIGGPKPKSSILKIMAKQQKFGTTRQFKNMQRIPFSGVLEIRGVGVDVQANGHVQRLQKAVIAELVLDVAEVEVDG